MVGWQARPQRRLPPDFPKPSGELGQNQKQRLVFCSHKAAAAGGREKCGFLCYLWVLGKGFFEPSGVMVTCQQETMGKDRGGQAGF